MGWLHIQSIDKNLRFHVEATRICNAIGSSLLACFIVKMVVPLGWYLFKLSTPYTPYTVGIYWVYPLHKGLLAGAKDTILRVPSFSLYECCLGCGTNRCPFGLRRWTSRSTFWSWQLHASLSRIVPWRPMAWWNTPGMYKILREYGTWCGIKMDKVPTATVFSRG